MFTGIIESLGKISRIEQENDNINFFIESNITHELKIDQSLAHNGVCLTVVEIKDKIYKVTAVKETINKTSLKTWNTDDIINLERALKVGDRLDGHFVQGHVDEIGTCINITNENGSWKFDFEYNEKSKNINIEKGSIAINGVSLTVFNIEKSKFSVAISVFAISVFAIVVSFLQLTVKNTINVAIAKL